MHAKEWNVVALNLLLLSRWLTEKNSWDADCLILLALLLSNCWAPKQKGVVQLFCYSTERGQASCYLWSGNERRICCGSLIPHFRYLHEHVTLYFSQYPQVTYFCNTCTRSLKMKQHFPNEFINGNVLLIKTLSKLCNEYQNYGMID